MNNKQIRDQEMLIDVRVVNELREGDILEEDIFANTKYPIVKKGTLLTNTHIHILKQFDIVQVEVRYDPNEEIVEVRPNQPKEEQSPTYHAEVQQFVEEIQPEEETDFEEVYRETLREYRLEFDRLRSGSKPNVPHIRQLIIPLIEKYEEMDIQITDLKMNIPIEQFMYHHHIRTSLVATAIARYLGYSSAELNQMSIAALLMDSGMAKLSRSIVFKERALTEQERVEIQKHVIHSYTAIQNSPIIKPEIKSAIVQHHERLDGTGYPLQLKFQDVSEIAQILSVADTYCAMTEPRPYRAAKTPIEVIEHIRYEQYGKFDLTVVEALQKLIGVIQVGTQVRLSNDQIGIVIQENNNNMYRPTVRVNGQTVELSKAGQYIEAIL